MRIGIDARILAYPKCGISTYVYNLVKNFLELDRNLEIFLFSDADFHWEYSDILSSPSISKVIFASSKKEKKKWAQIFLPKKLREYKIDIYHAPWNNAIPFLKSCVRVLTIHDLAPWILGRHFKNKRKELKYKLRHFFCAHWADLLITDSYKSQQDIIRLCRVKEDKVKVIYLGVDEEFKKDVDKDTSFMVVNKYKLDNKHYLIDPLGIDHPRRNSVFVLEGFNEVLKRKNYDLYLVYTGNFYRESKEYRNLVKRIEEYKLQDRVIITGWIPTQELKVLLLYAIISVIPSLYEGFGLPILESFSCGVPVVATDRGSIPEVVGDAGILVDPFNHKALADNIERLVENESLRKQLIEKGKKRVLEFDWRRTACETLKVYKSLMFN